MILKSVLIGTIIWLGALLHAAAGDLVVISASAAPDGPVPGDVLAQDREFSLAGGHEIVVIRQNGEVIRIAGPYEGRFQDHPSMSAKKEGGGDAADLSVIAGLFGNDNGLVTTLGSARNTRTGKAIPSSASIWEPYMIGTGKFCIDASHPIVHRQNAKKKVRLSLISPAFDFADFVWPSGEHRIRLDNPILETGKTYSLTFSDRAGQSSIITRPADLGDNAAQVIAWLTDAGCLRQARRLVAQLAAGAQ